MTLEKRFAIRLAKSVDLTTRLVERPAGDVEVLAPRDWTDARIEAWLDLGGSEDSKAPLLGIPAAFFQPLVAVGFYIAVALMWLIPDQRIERAVHGPHHG